MNSFLQFAGEVEKAGIWVWKGHSQEIIFSLLYSRRSWAMQPHHVTANRPDWLSSAPPSCVATGSSASPLCLR